MPSSFSKKIEFEEFFENVASLLYWSRVSTNRGESEERKKCYSHVALLTLHKKYAAATKNCDAKKQDAQKKFDQVLAELKTMLTTEQVVTGFFAGIIANSQKIYGSPAVASKRRLSSRGSVERPTKLRRTPTPPS